MPMKDFVSGRGIAAFSCAVLAVPICMRWVDAPVARWFGHHYHFDIVETLLGSPVLLSAEILLIAILFTAARVHGRFRIFLRTFTYACAASILAYGCNFLLKVAFGRPMPLTALQLDGHPLFHFFQGDKHSSFPSGHMALLSAFACVLWQSYPGMRLFLPLALCLAAAAIVVGNWHYVSDVIAGAALGSSAGLATAQIKAKRD